MLEPYAAPAADTDELAPRAPWERPVMCVALGIGWWLALLIPEASRGFLLRNESIHSPFVSLDALPTALSVPTLVWGFVRVVAIVGGACGLFAMLHRRFRKLRWLTALVCLWGGSGLFALTLGPLGMDSAFLALVAPAIFVLLAWYVVIPMTILTAIVLTNQLDARR